MAEIVHRHTNILNGGLLGTGALETTTSSLSGTLTGFTTVYTRVDIALAGYAFFPMIHSNDNRGRITGHSTDGASPDAARFSLINDTTTNDTYDVDYRSITA